MAASFNIVLFIDWSPSNVCFDFRFPSLVSKSASRFRVANGNADDDGEQRRTTKFWFLHMSWILGSHLAGGYGFGVISVIFDPWRPRPAMSPSWSKAKAKTCFRSVVVVRDRAMPTSKSWVAGVAQPVGNTASPSARLNHRMAEDAISAFTPSERAQSSTARRPGRRLCCSRSTDASFPSRWRASMPEFAFGLF